MKCNWQLQGPCSRSMCHWVVWLPCCRLSRAVLRSRQRSLSWMLISAQPLDNWGRRLSSWLAKSKAFPGILGTCPLVKDAQMKSHFCAIYSAHGGPQYCLLDTINSWSSGWEFISHVEREWYLENFRILFFLLFAKGLTFKVSEEVLLHLTLWKLIYNALMDWLPRLPFSPCAFNAPCHGIGKLCVLC